MRIVRCQTAQGSRYGIVEAETIRLLRGAPFEPEFSGATVPLEKAQLLAPCTPSKIVAVGINYASHAPEIGCTIPAEPLIFLKPSTTVIGPDDEIILPPMSRQVDFEGELAVVIGRQTKNISEAEVLEAVLGYTCCNDVTARDLQKKDVQFTRSKSFDTFAPLGPWIETDLNPNNLAIETRVNGAIRQQVRTSDMLRSVTTLVSFISQVMTLLPGDVIATGTPAGVGPLQAGDTVSITIEQLGTLTNRVRNQ